jgi:hypothetical protein
MPVAAPPPVPKELVGQGGHRVRRAHSAMALSCLDVSPACEDATAAHVVESISLPLNRASAHRIGDTAVESSCRHDDKQLAREAKRAQDVATATGHRWRGATLLARRGVASSRGASGARRGPAGGEGDGQRREKGGGPTGAKSSFHTPADGSGMENLTEGQGRNKSCSQGHMGNEKFSRAKKGMEKFLRAK